MIGLWKNTFFTFCWAFLIGIIISILITIIIMLFLQFNSPEIDGPGGETDYKTGENIKGLMMFMPILLLTSVVAHLYYTSSKSYSYGWSDAEEKHNIPEADRFCLDNEWCNWEGMYAETK
jgi:hypothetical protein